MKAVVVVGFVAVREAHTLDKDPVVAVVVEVVHPEYWVRWHLEPRERCRQVGSYLLKSASVVVEPCQTASVQVFPA